MAGSSLEPQACCWSAALSIDCHWIKIKSNSKDKGKINVKGVGQECPTHMGNR
jgi:hypothetical protein